MSLITSVADRLNHTLGHIARSSFSGVRRLILNMPQTPTGRVLLHPLLKPEILEWDMSTPYDCPPARVRKFSEPATTPPVRSMTFMIPGFPFHLSPLEPTPATPAYITVIDVLHYLHSHLTVWPLSNTQYTGLFGAQRDLAREKCARRNHVAAESQSDAYFWKNMRGVDLVPKGHYFGGLIHQRDANGANIWVVVLRESPIATPSTHLPHLLSPGHLIWDVRDPPPGVRSSQHFDIARKPLEICDISGHSAISIPPVKDNEILRPFDVPMVLEAIHAAMNVKVHNDDWRFWYHCVAQSRKTELREFSVAQTNPEITYLEMMPEERQRFLGLWHATTPSGDHYYTLVTQPSSRPLPQLHRSLNRGVTTWSIFLDPNRSTVTWLDEPAVLPRRVAMDVRIEFMHGSSWKLPIYRAKDADWITARHLLFTVHKFLAQDKFDIPFNKLPLHLQNRIQKRAAIRRRNMSSRGVKTAPQAPVRILGPKEDPRLMLSKEEIQSRRIKRPPSGFKRVDTLTKVICAGFVHEIGVLGEDEWKLCFKD